MTATLEEQGLIRLPDTEALQIARQAVEAVSGNCRPGILERAVERASRRLLAAKLLAEHQADPWTLGGLPQIRARGALILARWAVQRRPEELPSLLASQESALSTWGGPPWAAVDLALAWPGSPWPGEAMARRLVGRTLDPARVEEVLSEAQRGLDGACTALLAPPPAPERGETPEQTARRLLRTDPDTRLSWGLARGGSRSGGAIRRLVCPQCGRRSAWYLVEPEGASGWARCSHQGSCGWAGPLEDLERL